MKPVPATRGLLFGSFLYRSDLHTSKFLQTFWEDKLGTSFTLVPFHNPLANYYAQEMGPDLSRIFFLTSRAFGREALLATKLQSLDWEAGWSLGDKRMVNIDIGFLSLENFILATTKNFSHRQFIGNNIFGDLTYYFHQGKWQTLPWTYPDYQDDQKINFFTWARTFLLETFQS